MKQLNTKKSRYYNIILKYEEMLLASFLVLMIVMIIIQIILRNVFQTGIIGIDSFIRHIVLWIGFMGAALATEYDTHIKIDTTEQIMPPGLKKLSEIIVNIFSAVVCSVLCYASFHFVLIEFEGQKQLAFLNLPVWIIEIIMPAGYFIITIRFVVKGLKNMKNAIKG